MIKVKLLPRNIEVEVDAEEAEVQVILEKLRNELSSDGVLVLVNGRLVEDMRRVVRKGDTVVVVEEFLGG
ncbi:MoaD/ThiS family protein [Desulfurococcus mucosus]|uniref:ThiamineS protein n=1 Tax=Desulfurococcus mucosus (strain ATCC 35584 / DSM 2162 / JCM 9187 / O7/1) TaxID=765177 RepID=E8RA55_DESM0|nr:MoaD/ThiS family protein [Desulfurococcus mucosus]ADV64333.1 hypothetical protein Desmu_0014 [Desulfurococcus mucosus DSM 2162]